MYKLIGSLILVFLGINLYAYYDNRTQYEKDLEWGREFNQEQKEKVIRENKKAEKERQRELDKRKNKVDLNSYIKVTGKASSYRDFKTIDKIIINVGRYRILAAPYILDDINASEKRMIEAICYSKERIYSEWFYSDCQISIIY